jgi:ATP adenylyltransferase
MYGSVGNLLNSGRFASHALTSVFSSPSPSAEPSDNMANTFGDQLHLNEISLTSQFDDFVRRQIISYAECQPLIHHQHNGLSFEFTVAEALKKKPGVDAGAFSALQGSAVGATASQNRDTDKNRDGGLRPGSDIDTTGYEIGPLGNSHFLTFNKFCIYRPQMLILTNDGFRRQFEPLDMGDLAAARYMLKTLGGNYLALYNCGFESACSRLHKHMQVIPCARRAASSERPYSFWPDQLDDKTESKGSSRVPFQYRLAHFRHMNDLPTADQLYDNYQSHLQELGIGGSDSVTAHNVIIGERWIVTIPRRHAGIDGLSPNAAGMLGMIWLSTSEAVQKWKDAGPANVLAYAGVPRD